jgi:hypothetical protein
VKLCRQVHGRDDWDGLTRVYGQLSSVCLEVGPQLALTACCGIWSNAKSEDPDDADRTLRRTTTE